MIYPQTVGTALTGHTPGSTSVRQLYPLTFRHCFLSFQEGWGETHSLEDFLGATAPGLVVVHVLGSQGWYVSFRLLNTY